MHLLKRIREQRNKTQGQLAREIGVTQSALSQTEMNDKPPSMKTFLMLVHLGYIRKDNIYEVVQELIDKQWND